MGAGGQPEEKQDRGKAEGSLTLTWHALPGEGRRLTPSIVQWSSCSCYRWGPSLGGKMGLSREGAGGGKVQRGDLNLEPTCGLPAVVSGTRGHCWACPSRPEKEPWEAAWTSLLSGEWECLCWGLGANGPQAIRPWGFCKHPWRQGLLPAQSQSQGGGSLQGPTAPVGPDASSSPAGQPCILGSPARRLPQPSQDNTGRGTQGRPSSTWVDKTSSCLSWGKQCTPPHECLPGTYGWDLIRNRVFVGRLNLRPSHAGLGVGPKSNDRCPYKKGTGRFGDTEEKPRDRGGRDWKDMATNPRKPGARRCPGSETTAWQKERAPPPWGALPSPSCLTARRLKVSTHRLRGEPQKGASGGPSEFETGTQEQAVLPLAGCLRHQTHRPLKDELILLGRPTAISDSRGGEAGWGYI